MVDKCSRETILAPVVGACAGGEKEAAITAYNTLASYVVGRKSREKYAVLATEKS